MPRPLCATGGRLILLAHCPDGIGIANLFALVCHGRLGCGPLTACQNDYVGNGGTALAMMAKTRRIKISLVTELAPEDARSIGVSMLSPENVQSIINNHTGSLAVIPTAGMLVKIQGQP